MTTQSPILLFDGVCNFCDASINFVIERDPEGKFKYASLQSKVGEAFLKEFGMDTKNYDSFVLVDGETYYTKSTAALRVLKGLGGAWKLLYGFIIIPKPIRDAVYGLIAKNRYKWFGKKDACMLPDPEVQTRFLG